MWSEKNATHPGKPRPDPRLRLYLQQGQDCSDAGFDLRGARWQTFRDVSERFVDLLNRAKASGGLGVGARPPITAVWRARFPGIPIGPPPPTCPSVADGAFWTAD